MPLSQNLTFYSHSSNSEAGRQISPWIEDPDDLAGPQSICQDSYKVSVPHAPGPIRSPPRSCKVDEVEDSWKEIHGRKGIVQCTLIP